MLFFVAISNVSIDLERADVFSEYLTMAQFEDNYVLCVTSEDQLVLVNKKGEVLNRYNKKGQGPSELFRPYIMGIKNGILYICSNQRNIMRFDSQLNIIIDNSKSTFFSSKGLNVFGRYREQTDSFLIAQTRGASYLIEEWVQGKEQWERAGQYFKEPGIRSRGAIMVMRNCVFNLNGYCIGKRVMAINDNSYEIFVYSDVRETNQEKYLKVVLVGKLDEDYPRFKASPIVKCYIGGAFALEYGYIVQFKTVDPEARSEKTWWWDYFAKDGTFLQRKKKHGNHLVVMTNSKEVFYVDLSGDAVLLKNFPESDFPQKYPK
jgi:hypothetical protein